MYNTIMIFFGNSSAKSTVKILAKNNSPADYCARKSSLGPIALKIGLKVAGTVPASFEHMYVWFGLKLELSGQISAGELFWAKILKVDFAEEFPKKIIMIVL